MRSFALGSAGVAFVIVGACAPGCSSTDDATPQDGVDASSGGFEASTGSETSTSTDASTKTDGATTDAGPAAAAATPGNTRMPVPSTLAT